MSGKYNGMCIIINKSNCITKILITVTEGRKEYVNIVYHHHPAYLTYMQSTPGEMWDWMKHNLEIKLQEKYQ